MDFSISKECFQQTFTSQEARSAEIVAGNRPEEQSEDGGLATATGAHQGAAGSCWHLKGHILHCPLAVKHTTMLASWDQVLGAQMPA